MNRPIICLAALVMFLTFIIAPSCTRVKDTYKVADKSYYKTPWSESGITLSSAGALNAEWNLTADLFNADGSLRKRCQPAYHSEDRYYL
jgi:hypothetical protein